MGVNDTEVKWLRTHHVLGPSLTLAVILVAETLARWAHLDPTFSGSLLVLGLAPIAYSGLKGGLFNGVVATAMLAAYTLYAAGPQGTPIPGEPPQWTAVATITVLGLAMAYPMSRIKAREDLMRAALEGRAAALETRNRELLDANEALEAFGYVVSHDLKEPVRAVENYLSAAQEAWPNEEGRRFIDEAYFANERLSRLLHGLLAYSRTSSAAPQPRSVDVEAVLASDACTIQYLGVVRARGAIFTVEGPLPRVMGDEVILAQMLGNLLLNAVRHNPIATPHVTVRAEPAAAGRVHLVIADDGQGFPLDVQQRLGSLRERPATIKGGFGLVIANLAARRLGGSLRLHNPPGGGGEVHLDLPAAPEG